MIQRLRGRVEFFIIISMAPWPWGASLEPTCFHLRMSLVSSIPLASCSSTWSFCAYTQHIFQPGKRVGQTRPRLRADKPPSRDFPTETESSSHCSLRAFYMESIDRSPWFTALLHVSKWTNHQKAQNSLETTASKHQNQQDLGAYIVFILQVGNRKHWTAWGFRELPLTEE